MNNPFGVTEESEDMSSPLNYEIPTEMRDFAEKSVQQAKKALDGFLGAAQKAVDTLEGSTASLKDNASGATRKTLGYAEQNISAAFEHAEKLVRAKDVQEAMSLQTEFAKNQFAIMQTQMRELGEMASSAARSATEQATSVAKDAAAAARSAGEQARQDMQGAMNQASDTANRNS